MLLLFSRSGRRPRKTFMNDMKTNAVKMTTSNGESTDFVATGQVDFSLVDTDDGVNTKKQGKPVEIVYPDQDSNGIGVLILPNAVALIKGGPHPENGKRLIDYLLSKEPERKLAFADCAQIPLHSGVDTPPQVRPSKTSNQVRVGYADLARKMEEIQPFSKNGPASKSRNRCLWLCVALVAIAGLARLRRSRSKVFGTTGTSVSITIAS